MSKYLDFILRAQPKAHKTHSWTVRNKLSGDSLGQVYWYTAWRKYVFTPLDSLVFDASCLRELAEFCDQKTEAQKTMNQVQCLPEKH